MLKYDPVPGRIYDIVHIAMLKADFEGYTKWYLEKYGDFASVQTKRIYEYVEKAELVIDDYLRPLFSIKSSKVFIGDFLSSFNTYFSFESVEAFITWVRLMDKQAFLSHLYSFYSDGIVSVAECERLLECNSNGKLADMIETFLISDHEKMCLLRCLVDTNGVIERLSKIFLETNAVLQNVMFQYQDYLRPKIEQNVSVEMLERVNNSLGLEKKVLYERTVLYSFACINDAVQYYVPNQSGLFYIIGINFEWSCQHSVSISQIETFDLLTLGKAISDGKRIEILQLLEKGELYATEISQCLDIPNNSLFYHVNMLREANLITSRIDGRKVFYSINSKSYFIISEYFKQCYYKFTKEINNNGMDKTGS